MAGKWNMIGVAGAMMIAAAPVAAAPQPADVRAAIAAKAVRTSANVERDAGRKPAQVLGFLGLQRGMRVLDPFGSNLYWAEILAPAVGPKGHVTIWQPAQFMSPKARASLDAFAASHPNVTVVSSPFEAPDFGRGYDFTLINLDYHDVYWQNEKNKIVRMEPQAWLKRLYDAMKPGAVVGIIDHVAAPGSEPRASVEAMHRIDPAVVRADFRRAGFRLVGESNLLRNPGDDHSVSVFDEKIRGKTDRFLFKFRKPSR
jgi:predicted methyltransferase